MKPSQVEKLYSKLTSLELGTLAFNAIARLDEDEVESELIANNVEWQTYRSVHADYRRRVERLVLLASCYSMEHWKTRALMLQAFNLYSRGEEEDLGDLGINLFYRLESIEVALLQVCKQAKIDIESVKAFACIRDFQHLPEYADPELVAEYVVSFSGLLNMGG
jgi:hypothetical protein